MKPLLPALLLGVGLSTATVTPSVAYPVDCAILLCLAGGWPASAECAHARAVFIRRITPWPIEPPLQIWNCPMRVSFRGEPPPIERLYEIAFPADLAPPALPLPSVSATPILVDAQADVDISDPAFDFLRSIRVHQIEYWQRKDGEGSCHRATKLWLGTYGTQGDFNWARRADNIIPEAVDFRPPSGCHHYEYNSVFVEWKDFLGKEDNLEVRY